MGKKPPTASHRKFQRQQLKRSQQEDAEIKSLDAVIHEQAPARGTNPLALTDSKAPTYAAARKFEDLPLSRYTKDALKEAKFVTLTAIQRAALPHALAGRDVLGAAKTGSGKTLAFLIPLIERLYRLKWNKLDGLGALVVSPTRELALQIFEELRKVGKRHEFSAGLLIGGKDVAEEAVRVAGMNILVATPGRLLQHMDETFGFDASALQVLVLDEADRILDMGFAATLNAIVANLPKLRQTLLFSATQTKSVSALARLSLKDPEYVSAHAEASTPTPARLEQAWMEVALPDKLDVLWSFLKTHLRCRIIVFLSTCKEVRYIYEAFRRLRPGTPLRALHGRMSQYKRMGVYRHFCDSKAGVLFATDIAARGLDFPSIDWVVQFDCPEDVASYIHRVGRTARYTSSGRGLLLLLPSEREGMLEALAEANVPMKQLKQNPTKLQPVTPALQALLSKDAELKETAQRALVSYLRSVFLQPNRKVFDVTKLPAADFALSLGLPTAPKLRFLKRSNGAASAAVAAGERNEATGRGNASMQAAQGNPGAIAAAVDVVAAEGGSSSEEDEDGSEAEQSQENNESDDSDDSDRPEHRDKVLRSHKDNDNPVAFASTPMDEDSDDELLRVKRRHDDNDLRGNGGIVADDSGHLIAGSENGPINLPKKRKRMKIKPGVGTGTRVVFGDDGEAMDPLALLGKNEISDDDPDHTNGVDDALDGAGMPRHPASGLGLHNGIHGSVAERAAVARAKMVARDAEDKVALRALRKAQRDERRAKRLAREAPDAGATLGDFETASYDSGFVKRGGGGLQGKFSSEEGEEEEAGGGRGEPRGSGRQGSDGSDWEVDVDLLGSDSEGGDGEIPRTLRRHKAQPRAATRAGAGAEVAHIGMVPAPRSTVVAVGKQTERDGGGVGGLSLTEQEALALHLLRQASDR